MRDRTLDWYQKNAEAYIGRTENTDLSGLYRAFLKHVPPGGRIMDLGCGAGSATAFFTQMGYPVLAVDACPSMCEHTRARAGCPVRVMRFEELDYEDAFDGIWACASLLHVRKADLPVISRLIRRALKTGGVLYASFKYGDTERESEGRAYTDLTEDALLRLMNEAGGFRRIALWRTADVLPGRENETWVNALFRAV